MAFPKIFKTRVNGESIYMDVTGPFQGSMRNWEQCDACGGGEMSVVWSQAGEPQHLLCDTNDCGARYTLIEIGA